LPFEEPEIKSPMRINRNLTTVILLISALFFFSSFLSSPVKKISCSMETVSLTQNKKFRLTADIYYNYSSGKLIMHYSKPSDYLLLTNSKGEAKMYNPKTNEVSLKMGFEYDTKNTLLYYFFANKQYDLGLKDLGFSLKDTKFDEGLMITTWQPPFDMKSAVGKVELVHENYLPIYLGYFSPEGKLTKKIYYYEYTQVANVKLPLKVVEFNYLSNNDSLVSRTIYSNIKYNEQANSKYFSFKIPDNAKVID
jgi:outer membrane lipoprotein-sorting protein